MRCQEKVVFESKKKAYKLAIRNIFFYSDGNDKFDVYKCDRCLKFHITKNRGKPLSWWEENGSSKVREYIKRYRDKKLYTLKANLTHHNDK